MTVAGDAAAICTALSRAFHSVSEIDIRHFEGKGSDELENELKPCVVRELDAAMAIMRRALELFDRSAERDNQPSTEIESSVDNFELEVDRIMAAAPPASKIADVAFMANVELKERKSRFAGTHQNEPRDKLLSECDSAIRRVRKTLAAVEQVICEHVSGEPQLEFTTELEISLRTRRNYARFRYAVVCDGEPAADNLVRRMRGAGTQIAMLIGRDIYPDLRIRDRLQIRDFQTKILDWLRDSPEDTRSGLRIWQDLCGFLEILTQVNRRQELIDHDQATVEQLWQELYTAESGSAPRDFTEEGMTLVERLKGLDFELDAVLRDGPTPEALRPVIERLRKHFGLASSPEIAGVVPHGNELAALSFSDDNDFF